MKHIDSVKQNYEEAGTANKVLPIAGLTEFYWIILL